MRLRTEKSIKRKDTSTLRLEPATLYSYRGSRYCSFSCPAASPSQHEPSTDRQTPAASAFTPRFSASINRQRLHNLHQQDDSTTACSFRKLINHVWHTIDPSRQICIHVGQVLAIDPSVLRSNEISSHHPSSIHLRCRCSFENMCGNRHSVEPRCLFPIGSPSLRTKAPPKSPVEKLLWSVGR